MDIRFGNKYPSGALSNFAARIFIFQNIPIASMEGLLQSFKFSNPEMQKYICSLVGKKAKYAGRYKNWRRTQSLWWQGNVIKRNSEQYQHLLDEAFVSLFTQNQRARQALLATQNAILTHRIGKKKIQDTVLTEQEFCSRLMSIRDLLKETNNVDGNKRKNN